MGEEENMSRREEGVGRERDESERDDIEVLNEKVPEDAPVLDVEVRIGREGNIVGPFRWVQVVNG